MENGFRRTRLLHNRIATTYVVLYLVLVALVLNGCARPRWRHRFKADADAHALILEKSAGTPWQTRPQYSAYPDPASRWQLPGGQDCPVLPDAAPLLYSYQLPLIDESNGSQGVEGQQSSGPNSGMEGVPGNQQDQNDPVVNPIPPAAWNEIPEACRRRMFDFVSLRREAERTTSEYEVNIHDATSDETPRLKLHDLIDLAILNSRNYQSQKEALYRVALQLSQERFAYQLNPTANGNGTSGDFVHNRDGGVTVNNLSVGTRGAMQKMLVTGGDVLASFANNVLLTFNGPQGFAADVSSSFLMDITQPLLQTDIRFESLTQAERNVVYAARDFARFRKSFFADFAQQYYSLIRSYRQIEIESQNYFSLVRAFNQAEAEYRAGLVPRFQVDQVEQNLLSGRGSLIGTCNGVEQSLDSLKIALGIPVETLINIDLTELDDLTQYDQLAVAADLVSRVQRRLSRALQNPVQIELLSTSVVLIDRILEADTLRQQLDLAPLETGELVKLRARMLVESARLAARETETSLRSEADSASPSQPVIFQRTLALTGELHGILERQLDLFAVVDGDPSDVEEIMVQRSEGVAEVAALGDRLQQMIRDEQMQQLPNLVQEAEEARSRAVDLVNRMDQLLEISSDENATPAKTLQTTIDQANSLLTQSGQILETIGNALEPVDIEVDDAMITALVLRFDLMNQRGLLADDWRQIKLAADNLRSVLDLNASQRIGTDRTTNNPFNFTFDESQTAIGVTFDAPLNRQAQRNSYRNSLLNYQAGIRDLGGLEDNIKFAVRNDLRNLALDREQYIIAVASAALAFERVVSTSLEFRLGTGGVSARDFLEAQTAYTGALSSVASRHIDYIVDRTQLFLDMELLTVNDRGFWDELYNEAFQPDSYFEMPAWSLPAYGYLPSVNYSGLIRNQMSVGPGQPAILRPVDDDGTEQDDATRIPMPEFED